MSFLFSGNILIQIMWSDSFSNSATRADFLNLQRYLGLYWCSYCYPCLSPLPVLGVPFLLPQSVTRLLYSRLVRCLRLEDLLKLNTVSHSPSLPPLCIMVHFRYAVQLLSLCTVTITIYSQQLAFQGHAFSRQEGLDGGGLSFYRPSQVCFGFSQAKLNAV